MTVISEPSDTGIIVRPAIPADADAIADLHARSWRATYRGIFSDAFLDGPVFAERRALWAERLSTWDTRRNVALLAQDADRLVGFASVMLDQEPEFGARLDNLHVDPAAKGHGIGRLLMRHAARWVLDDNKAPMLHLMVFEDNVAARGFYDALRGECVERREVTVEDGTRLVELRYLWTDLDGLASG